MLKSYALYAFLAALALSSFLGYCMPLAIDNFNDARFSKITILDEPELMEALRYAQDKGVYLCVHGWEHEDFTAIHSVEEARSRVGKALEVFEKGELTPTAWWTPYIPWTKINPSSRLAINSFGISPYLPYIPRNSTEWGEYTWNWRTMTSFDDPRYEAEWNRIMYFQHNYLLLHVQDWNQFMKKFVTDYLEVTSQRNITVRFDDPEVNTPPWKIYDITDTFLQYDSVGQIGFGVIPSGTWSREPVLFDIISVNSVMRGYWVFYLVSALFPLSFFIFWRFTHRNNHTNKKMKKPPQNNNGKQHVSVIIPAFNEEKNVGSCIEAVLNQEFDGEMEIIVINDGSTDKTAQIVSKYPVKLIDLPNNVGKANALNIGIMESKGDILVFSDSDSQMAPGAVTALVKALEDDQNVGAVAGNVLINDSGNLLRYFQMIEYHTEQEINRYVQSINGQVLVCPGPLFATRRSVVEEVKFSDKSIIEDANFTVDVLKKSWKVHREPTAEVYTEAPYSIGDWFKQRKRWWYGNLQLWNLHKPWAKKNPWMILNYLGFIINLTSLILMVSIPFFLLTYENLTMALLRSIGYVIAPILFSTILIAPFFIRKKKLLLMIIPYTLLYQMLKVLTVSYLYIRYLLGKGETIVFGPRIIKVK